jgi:hypothetical protein
VKLTLGLHQQKAKNGKPGECGEWTEDDIPSIKYIQFLGQIDLPDEIISKECE